MKKTALFLTLALFTGTFFLSSCGGDAEAEAKRIADSTRVADSLKHITDSIHVADSLAQAALLLEEQRIADSTRIADSIAAKKGGKAAPKAAKPTVTGGGPTSATQQSAPAKANVPANNPNVVPGKLNTQATQNAAGQGKLQPAGGGTEGKLKPKAN